MIDKKEAAPGGANAGNGGGTIAAGGCIIIPVSLLYHWRSGYATGSTMNFFDEVKQRVSCFDAARLYGYEPNRTGFICCPLHGEKTPSLKLYPGAGGWHCFGCGHGGSVIDFAAQLFGVDAMGAIRRLNEDFHLALPLDRPPSRAESEQAQRRQRVADTYKMFSAWRERMLGQLNSAYRTGHLALKDKHPDTWTDAETLAFKWMPTLESWADSLDYGGMEAQMQIFRDRKGVERLCRQILNSTPEKSATA